MKWVIFFLALTFLLISGCNTDTACTQDAKVCDDGSSVGRVPQNCEFAPCPTTIICAAEVMDCPDGSTVERVPPNCDFALCPTATGFAEDFKISPD